MVTRGVVLAVFGLVVLIWPSLTLTTLVVLVGIAAIVDGASGVLTAIMARGSDSTRRWLVGLVGAVTLIVGLVVLTRPDSTIAVLTMLAAFWALVVGVERIAYALTYHQRASAWGWLLGSGLATMALGLVLLFWPNLILVAAAVIIGVANLVAGAVTIIAGVVLRSAVRNRPESLTIEGEIVQAGPESDPA